MYWLYKFFFALLLFMLSIVMTFTVALCSFELNAAEVTRGDIRKTLQVIKEKYDESSTKNRIASSNVKYKSQQIEPQNASNPNIEIISQTDRIPSFNSIPESEIVSRFALGEELIFGITLGDIQLGDAFAIVSQTGFKIGLTEFFQIVDFPIDVDVDNVWAEGQFNGVNKFSLLRRADNKLVANINNREYVISSEQVLIEDDIYVELSELAKWFAFDAKVDEARLVIYMTSDIPFSIEKDNIRRNRKVITGGQFSDSVLPLQHSPYQLYSVPLLDAQVSTRFSQESKNASAYSILSSQDAAYFSSQLYLNGNDNNHLSDARLTLSRQSLQADLLGPLHMTEYAFGDVTPVNIGVGGTQSLGRGFSMNNAANRLVDNRQVNLKGEIQVGWDVELYRNGVLLDTRLDISIGRYEFNDIELSYGYNDFELVFYGPQGQIERRTETYNVNQNILNEGQGIWQFSVVDNNHSLFGVGDSTSDKSLLGPVLSTVYDYGVNDWLSLGVGALLFNPEEGEMTEAYTLRSNITLGSYGLFNSIFQLDKDKRRSMLQSFRTKLANVALDVSYRREEYLTQQLDATNNPNLVDYDNIRVRFSGALFDGSSLPVSYDNSWSKTEFENGNKLEQFENAIGINTRWGGLTNGLIWLRSTEQEELGKVVDLNVSGSLAYTARMGKVFTRLFSNYQIEPVAEFYSFGTTLNYPINNNLNSELRYTYDVLSKNDTYNFRLSWSGDSFALSGTAGYDRNDQWSVNLSLRMGLGYEPNTDTFFTSGRRLGDSGAVLVRMFEDENLDKLYNEGETVLQDVNVKAVQAFREENTTYDGVAVLTSLPTERATDIIIDESTFSDPSMMVAANGFAIAARRGLIQQFDIPVVKGGELDGSIYWLNADGVEQVAPHVRLNLVDANGDVIATTRSEYDGYYLFDKILPGTYQIYVDTSAGLHRGMVPERFKEVRISNRGDLITDVDLVLRQLKSANGYIANVGSFSSIGLLKVYYNLLSRRVPPKFFDDVFFIKTKQSDRYILGLKYNEGQGKDAKNSMVDFCKKLTAQQVDCLVDNVDFEY